jgi:hypothetical protein
MLSRRKLILATGIAGVSAALDGRQRPAREAAWATVTPPDFPVPESACDCHQHIIGDRARFPMAPTRKYTPGEAPLSELQNVHRVMKIKRAVLVQPSFYGADNSCLLSALR